MSFSFGKNIITTIFGQSHSAGIGVVIDGLPAGFAIDFIKLEAFMAKRAPITSPLTTPRKEADKAEVISGLMDGRTCGAPLCAFIKNNDVRSSDYDNDIPRPSHADYTAFIKFGGNNDYRGGGAFSGRMTAPLCFAGAVCKQILEEHQIYISAHISSIGSIKDDSFDPVNIGKEGLLALSAKDFPTLNNAQGEKMKELIREISSEGDSIGGVIECAISGVPVGIGSPMFEGIENRLASSLFAVPAVKGIEFGSGFSGSMLKGSENNDAFCIKEGKIRTKTNNHGGILGGISSGMPIVFRTAFKPTPSIAKDQDSVSFSDNTEVKLYIKGRHDPCIALRAVPCIEAVTAIVLLDMLLDFKKDCKNG